MVPTLFLAAAVGFKLFAAAPDHIWSNGTVLDVDATRRILAREEDSTARTVRRGFLYAVQSDTSIYLTEEVENGQRAARLKGNVEVMFRLDGDTLFILGDDGKERETHVLRTISRTGEQQVAPAPDPQPPSRVVPVDSAGTVPKAQPEVQPAPLVQQSKTLPAPPPPSQALHVDNSAVQSNIQPEPRTSVPVQQLPPTTSLLNMLPEATPVRMRISRSVSSADAQVGENVDFETLDDVKVGGYVVIPSGSVAIATITDAVSKKRMARGGRLSMNIDYVRLPTGGKLPLRGVQDAKGGGHTGAMTGGMVATAIVFWPAAPFFLFMHGKDVTIPKGHEVTVYTNTDYQLPSVTAAIPTAAATPAPVAPAQRPLSGSPLTNADVLKLKGAGLSDQFIIDKIKASPANYHLDVDDLVELKKAGIPETIIDAMIQASQR